MELAAGYEVKRQVGPSAAEDVAMLSPLSQQHINLLGRYSFAASQPREGLRPLRDPAARDTEEELA